MAFYPKSVVYTRTFKMISSTDHLSLKTAASPVVNISKAGAAFGAAAGTVTEVANGWYKVALTTADTGTAGDLSFYITGTGADDTDFVDQVVDPTVANLGVNTVNINNVAAATPGASGGILISGSNAGTTTLAALTVTGTFTVSDGIAVTRSTTNGIGFAVTGNGTGSGLVCTSGSGATGDGMQVVSASTNGRGLKIFGTGSADGITINAGTTGNGITVAAGVTSGVGISISTTSGDGINVSAGTNGTGMVLVGNGSGHGLHTTAGTTGGASSMKLDGGNAGLNIAPTNGIGFSVSGGASAVATQFTGGAGSAGLRVVGGTTTGNGFEIIGTGSGNGCNMNGGATGNGWALAGGATSGDGIIVTTTVGHGINVAATGTSKHGMTLTGGTAGTSDGLHCAAGTGGVDIRGNITGNLVGTVSTLTTYTGNTVQTGDAYARLGAPAGASVSADIATKMATYSQPTGFLAATFPTTVASPTNITAGTITTVTNLTNAPTAGDFTATMKTSIGTAVAASAVASVTAAVTVTGDLSATMKTSVTTACTASTPTAAAVTGAVGSVTAGCTLTSGERNSVADALLDRTAGIETNFTLRQAHRLLLSALAAKLSGAATSTVVIRDVNDTTNRITATVDANGNRTAITTNVT